MTIEVIATSRAQQGTGASRRLRHAGKVPGIVYGAGQEPVAIELDHNNLYYAMQNEVFHASVLSLVIDGKAEPVLIRDAQYHPWKQIVMHVDFQRVDADQGDPHQGAAALHQRRQRTWREGSAAASCRTC